MNRPPRIAVVGSVNIDLVARVERFPLAGQTVLAHDLQSIPGGKGANQAVAAAKLGAEVDLIGRVGDDAFARPLKDSLESAGVNTRALLTTKATSSGTALIQVDAHGENMITVAAGANGELSPDDIEAQAELIAQADMLLLQLEVPLPTVVAAAEAARRHAVPVILDPAPAPTGALPQALHTVDLISPNETEAMAIVTEAYESPEEVASHLQDLGARQVVLKRGSQGAIALGDNGTSYRLAAPAVDVVVTTAAGDAFTAALAVRLALNEPLIDAVRYACAAGAFAVTRLGAQQAMPTAEEVAGLLI